MLKTNRLFILLSAWVSEYLLSSFAILSIQNNLTYPAPKKLKAILQIIRYNSKLIFSLDVLLLNLNTCSCSFEIGKNLERIHLAKDFVKITNKNVVVSIFLMLKLSKTKADFIIFGCISKTSWYDYVHFVYEMYVKNYETV